MEQDDEVGWGQLDQATRQSKLSTLAELKRMCTSHSILSFETVNCLQYMTSRYVVLIFYFVNYLKLI